MDINDRSPFNRMPNIDWLMKNAGSRDRYPRLQMSGQQLANLFKFDAAQVSRMRAPRLERSMRDEEVEKWLAASGLREVHPEFKSGWLDLPRHRFELQMQLISFGSLDGEQPHDSSSLREPHLQNFFVLPEETLLEMLNPKQQRGDLGTNIRADLLSQGPFAPESRIVIQLKQLNPHMQSALHESGVTFILLFRSIREPNFRATPCLQQRCLHFFNSAGKPIHRGAPRRLRSGGSLVIGPESHDTPPRYGFSVPNLPERIELFLVLSGQYNRSLSEWSEKGGLGVAGQWKDLRKLLANGDTAEKPLIAGRFLIDIGPPRR